MFLSENWIDEDIFPVRTMLFNIRERTFILYRYRSILTHKAINEL
jgi:hypothetical protein